MIKHTHIQSNFYSVDIKDITIYFSYQTPIAFKDCGQLFISNNEWGTTTGKHLNIINRDHKIRIDHALLLSNLDYQMHIQESDNPYEPDYKRMAS